MLTEQGEPGRRWYAPDTAQTGTFRSFRGTCTARACGPPWRPDSIPKVRDLPVDEEQVPERSAAAAGTSDVARGVHRYPSTLIAGDCFARFIGPPSDQMAAVSDEKTT